MPPDFDLQPDEYLPLIQRAVAEDLGSGDITSQVAVGPQVGRFHLVAREPGILCGRRIAEAIVAQYGKAIRLQWTPAADDGKPLIAGEPLAVIEAPACDVLAAERVLLNFLQHLCGVATLTSRHVNAVAHTSARIFDTRKTTPGLRALEKYAVRCGGGHNHRKGLYDAILIKDNHVAGIETAQLADSVFQMLNRAAQLEPPPAFVEVEVDTLEQLGELFKVVGIDVILLDNFTPGALREAVRMRNDAGLQGKLELEASGGIDLQIVARIADTGVDRIAVGALTHSARAIDIGLETHP